MNQSFFAKLLNIFWTTLAMVLITFALYRHYLSSKWALIAACTTAVVLQLIILKVQNRRLSKKGIKTKELDHAERVLKALYVAQKEAVDLFFYNAILKTCPNSKLQNGWILTDKYAICCCFSEKTTSVKELTDKIANCPNKEKQRVVFGIGFEPEANCLNIKLNDGVSTYAFLKTQKTFPKVEHIESRKKHFFKGILSRKLFWRYLFLSLVFAISGYFVPQTKLYFAFTIISSILAISCLFVKNKKDDEFTIS